MTKTDYRIRGIERDSPPSIKIGDFLAELCVVLTGCNWAGSEYSETSRTSGELGPTRWLVSLAITYRKIITQ